MDVPERLWSPSPKDELGDFNPAVFFFRRQVTATSGAILSGLGPGFSGGSGSAIDIPTDKVLRVNHIHVICAATGGENCTGFNVNVFDTQNLNPLCQLFDERENGNPAAADYVPKPTVSFHYKGNPFWFGPGGPNGNNLVLSGFFSAAVASKFVRLSVAGILVPRGNWQMP